jgi:CHAD domain-containing protein
VAYRFRPDETLDEAFSRTMREELTAAETALTHDARSDPVAAVHSSRKSLKKARSLLRLMRGTLDSRDRRHENAALRDTARRLSGTRDADVMLESLDELARRYAGQIPQHHFEIVHERLRDGAPPIASPTAGTGRPQAAAELGAIRGRVAGWTVTGTGWGAVQSGVRRGYKRGRAAFAQARKEPTAEHLHEWRKRVKDLWYHLRLLAPVCGEAVKGHAKDAHALADLLGDDHDLAVLRERLTGIAVAADVDAVVSLIDHRRDELQAEAMALGKRVYAERPKAFARRLRACWKAGQRRRREEEHRSPAELADATRAVAVH